MVAAANFAHASRSACTASATHIGWVQNGLHEWISSAICRLRHPESVMFAPQWVGRERPVFGPIIFVHGCSIHGKKPFALHLSRD